MGNVNSTTIQVTFEKHPKAFFFFFFCFTLNNLEEKRALIYIQQILQNFFSNSNLISSKQFCSRFCFWFYFLGLVFFFFFFMRGFYLALFSSQW